MTASADEIVSFWRQAGPDRWFTKDFAFDTEIREQFFDTYEAAAAGKFSDCIVVEETHPESRTVTTFARGTGQIRIEVYDLSNNQLVARGELRGYHKAGTPAL